MKILKHFLTAWVVGSRYVLHSIILSIRNNDFIKALIAESGMNGHDVRFQSQSITSCTQITTQLSFLHNSCEQSTACSQADPTELARWCQPMTRP